MACGTEDDFLNANRVYRDLFTENGLDVTYCEEAGGHDWDFWDKYILVILLKNHKMKNNLCLHAV